MKLVLAVFALGLAVANAAPKAVDALKVCSFNVQIFGANKAKRSDVMEILGNIFRRYDLCLIQEIRDTGDESINALLAQINGKTDNYRLIVSDRLGRSNSKEQYGFFYNKNKIQVADSFHFDDDKYGDLFEREPFVVRFKVPKGAVTDFFIGGIHTNPGNAKEEIGNLTKVYDDAVKRFKIQDGIIMGDYNAGCGYFAKKYWPENAFRQDKRFKWLIGDDADTTVGKADCPYDRVVVGGSNLQSHIPSAETYFYDDDMGINDADLVKKVSDHYPVQFNIQ